jgi:hypothetical protein
VDILERIVEASQDMCIAVARAYKIMNYYGSAEQMEKWSRPDPIQVIGSVYFVMADPYNNLKKVLEEFLAKGVIT